jgi:hypothetical protein
MLLFGVICDVTLLVIPVLGWQSEGRISTSLWGSTSDSWIRIFRASYLNSDRFKANELVEKGEKTSTPII